MTRVRSLALVVVLATVAFAPAARSNGGLNIDFGTAYGVPFSFFSAASGQAGTWNMAGLGGTPLVGLSGAPSGTSVNVVAGFDTGSYSPPNSTTGLLLNDNFFTSGAGASWSVDLSGLANGDYLVFLYAPDSFSFATGDMTVGGVPVASIPGSGNGTLVEGASWVKVQVTVTAGTIAISGSGPGWTGLAGLQIVPLQPPTAVNIDFGTAFGVPAPSYGAASGQTGTWNQLGTGSTTLVDLSGAPTEVTAGFSGLNVGNAPGTPTNDDELLLMDHSTGGCVGSCPWGVSLSFVPPGDYLVYLYAPTDSLVSTGLISVNNAQFLPSLPGHTGSALIEGTSWAKAQVTVTDSGFYAGKLSISGGAVSSLMGLAALQVVPVAGFENYCTAGTSASSCQATLSASGTPSATATSGFDLLASNAEGSKNGIFFYGTNGRQANPWGNGTSLQCVVPPVRRAGLLLGSGTSGQCDGAYSQDLNARWTAKPSHNPGAGAVVQAQLWYRDPQNTSNQTTSLSDAIEFTVNP